MGMEEPMGGRSVPIRTKETREQINWKDKNIPGAVSAFQILHCDNKEAVHCLWQGAVCNYKSKTLFEQAVLLLTYHLLGTHTTHHHHHFVLCADYSTVCEGVLKAGGLPWKTRFGPCCVCGTASPPCTVLRKPSEQKFESCCFLLWEESRSCMWAVRDLLVLVFPHLPDFSKCCAAFLPWGTCSVPVFASGLQGSFSLIRRQELGWALG